MTTAVDGVDGSTLSLSSVNRNTSWSLVVVVVVVVVVVSVHVMPDLGELGSANSFASISRPASAKSMLLSSSGCWGGGRRFFSAFRRTRSTTSNAGLPRSPSLSDA